VDFPGAVLSASTNISNPGDLVGFYRSGDGAFHGFLLHAGSFSAIDFPGASSTEAFGINDAGLIVARYALGGQDPVLNGHGFLLQKGTFTSFDFPGGVATTPLDINDAGQVVGFYHDTSGNDHGFEASGLR
jgi:uncharacterized membrane protein